MYVLLRIHTGRIWSPSAFSARFWSSSPAVGEDVVGEELVRLAGVAKRGRVLAVDRVRDLNEAVRADDTQVPGENPQVGEVLRPRSGSTPGCRARPDAARAPRSAPLPALASRPVRRSRAAQRPLVDHDVQLSKPFRRALLRTSLQRCVLAEGIPRPRQPSRLSPTRARTTLRDRVIDERSKQLLPPVITDFRGPTLQRLPTEPFRVLRDHLRGVRHQPTISPPPG